MPRESATLPGYIGLTASELAAADDLTVEISVKGLRINEPFLVRTEQAVQSIEDGWLCQDSDGRAFGVEDAQMGGLLLLEASVEGLDNAQIGVAFSASLDNYGEGAGRTATHFALAAGSGLPAGLALDAAGTLSGTPPGPGGAGAYYFEVDVTFDDATVARQKRVMAVFPALLP